MRDENKCTSLYLFSVQSFTVYTFTFLQCVSASQNLLFLTFYTGYLMKEVKKADISLPEGDVNPIAPLPKHILSIMVSYPQIMCRHVLNS